MSLDYCTEYSLFPDSIFELDIPDEPKLIPQFCSLDSSDLEHDLIPTLNCCPIDQKEKQLHENLLHENNEKRHRKSNSSPQNIQNKRYRRASEIEKQITMRMTGIHTPSIMRGNKNKDIRQFCMVCRTRKTKYHCVECSVYLCIEGKQLDNCWYRFHHLETYLPPKKLDINTTISTLVSSDHSSESLHDHFHSIDNNISTSNSISS